MSSWLQSSTGGLGIEGRLSFDGDQQSSGRKFHPDVFAAELLCDVHAAFFQTTCRGTDKQIAVTIRIETILANLLFSIVGT